jgi:hypothetical protein
MHESVTELDELLGVERMAVKKEQEKVAKLEQAVVTLEIQVAEAGNEKMVGFLLELIEGKQRFLECPVCLEESASPILSFAHKYTRAIKYLSGTYFVQDTELYQIFSTTKKKSWHF